MVTPRSGKERWGFSVGSQRMIKLQTQRNSGEKPSREREQPEQRQRLDIGSCRYDSLCGAQSLFRDLGKVGWAAGHSLDFQAWESGLHLAALESPSQGQWVEIRP